MTTGRINQVRTNQIAALSRVQHNGITCYPLDWKLFRALWNSVRFFLSDQIAKQRAKRKKGEFLTSAGGNFDCAYDMQLSRMLTLRYISVGKSCSCYLHFPHCPASTRDALQLGTRDWSQYPQFRKKRERGVRVITTTVPVLQELYWPKQITVSRYFSPLTLSPVQDKSAEGF